MIIYEVNARIPASESERYGEFLDAHIQKLLALPGFKRADIWTRQPTDEQQSNAISLWTVHYHVEDRGALDAYLKFDAPKIRSEATDLFGERLHVQRRILHYSKSVG